MGRVRPPAVAGRFYPEEPELLARTVAELLEQAPVAAHAAAPRALIVPHAGYVYSGSAAACGFKLLAPHRGALRRVVIIGPAHYVPFMGLALPPHEAFATPLGTMPVDREGVAALLELPQVSVIARPHLPEHALEVELPFLQQLFGPLLILPLLFGGCDDGETAEAIARVWDEETLLVVSSDLSHFQPYEEARRHDERTAAAIERLDRRAIGPDDACGYRALRALLALARERGLRAERLALHNSGDVGGGRDSVVGYGAWALF